MEAIEFIDNILNKYQIQLPNYIKLLLNNTGIYNNIISISKLHNACITELKRFTIEDLTKLLNNELLELFGKIYNRHFLKLLMVTRWSHYCCI